MVLGTDAEGAEHTAGREGAWTRVPEPPDAATVVLCSGGLDSVVLLAWAAARERAHPVYVRAGLAWEAGEIRALQAVLARPPLAGRVAPLAVLEFDVRDLYPASHWALRGTPPAYDTPDEDVFLPGRNLLLLSKAAVLALSRDIGALALGPLAGNPFPDATPEFFAAMSRALTLGLAHDVRVLAPFTALHKADVIRLGVSLGLPLEFTLSCMTAPPASPDARKPGTEGTGPALHCGLCSKCRERRDAFAEAGIGDPTAYRAPSPRGVR